jgi:hypothetical protein
MRYLHSYLYLFESPKWLKLVGIGALSSLVPIVGPIVFLGYLYGMVADLRHRGEGRPPDFDLNRLMAYLMRGLWPFLVQMVVGMVANVILVPIVLAVMFGCVSVWGMPEGLLISYAFILPISIFFGCLLQVVLIPMSLRAAYHLDFASAFDGTYVKDFIRRVGKELVISQLFLFATALGLGIVGLLLCYVGLYFVIPIIQFAQYHLIYQLQKLHEERGGVPLTFKPDADGPGSHSPSPASRDEREGSYAPEERPGPSTGIQGKETGSQE